MLIDALAFFWGVSGFVAFEGWQAYNEHGPQKRRRDARFWITRAIMCGIAGQVASAAMPLFHAGPDRIPLGAMVIGFSTPALPNLMAQLLRLMIGALEHGSAPGDSPDIDISKVFNPPPNGSGAQKPRIPPASQDESSEEQEDQPVNHH